jgi:hypothetical protein
MARNEELPGVEGEGVSPQKTIKSIEDALADLVSAREKRMSWAEKEGAASTVLIALFHKHNITRYVFDEKPYVLVDIEKVKVERKPKEDED